jgi:histidyl-tRNA synthetase
VTGIIQETWRERENWAKTMKNRNVFYNQRWYRYEKPQRGRYRGFTQLGIEMLGESDDRRAKELLSICLYALGGLTMNGGNDQTAKLGLVYYVSDGFEAACPNLGAQKQIAGGIYSEGVGWAIGIDRILSFLCKIDGRKPPIMSSLLGVFYHLFYKEIMHIIVAVICNIYIMIRIIHELITYIYNRIMIYF